MLPSREELLREADALPETPVAFEASWDGDSSGWFVALTAVLRTGAGYRDHHLATLQEGGDLRLFNGQVPPWPEARRAREVGAELADRFGVPFYFPSPHHPEDQCPSWAERDRGYPCRRCGIPLLQRDPCPWRGVCYHCHLEEERETKEAAWTPEERAGPRCHLCGNPARGTIGTLPACIGCVESYETYRCSGCGAVVLVRKTELKGDLCLLCDVRARLEGVPVDVRRAIRAAATEGDEFAAIVAAKNLLGWSLYDARAAVHVLSGPSS